MRWSDYGAIARGIAALAWAGRQSLYAALSCDTCMLSAYITQLNSGTDPLEYSRLVSGQFSFMELDHCNNVKMGQVGPDRDGAAPA